MEEVRDIEEEMEKTKKELAAGGPKDPNEPKTSVERAKQILEDQQKINLQQFNQGLQQLQDKHKLFLQARVIIDGSNISSAVLALPRME